MPEPLQVVTPASAAVGVNTAPDLLDTIKNALKELITLRVVTSVGTVTVQNGNPEIRYDDKAKVMLTKIDLLQGDLEMSIDPMFLDAQYASVLALHTEHTKDAKQTVQSNIDALKKLVALVRDLK